MIAPRAICPGKTPPAKTDKRWNALLKSQDNLMPSNVVVDAQMATISEYRYRGD
jgi:hypothetical protein